jgi:hypothetical protein
MKYIILAYMTIYMMHNSVEAVVQSVGPGDKVTVDQWGGKFVTDKYRSLNSNKCCWDKFDDDKIILTEY